MPTYEAIEGIQIGGFDPGKWRNSVIFSADFDIGFTDKPTKFIINCVNVTGQYAIDESDLSYINPWQIQFGPFQFRFYLEKYQIQKAAGKRILQLTFVDGSTVMDRIFVALGDKHVEVKRSAGNILPCYFPVLCEAPEFYPPVWATNGLVNLSKISPMYLKNSMLDTNSIWNMVSSGGKVEEGGMITVGWEQPSIENFHKDCAISDFKYNFYHLLTQMENFGIDIGGDFIKWDYTDPDNPVPLIDTWGQTVKNDRNPFHYESFAGQTLREVLNQWCSIQGFSWYYDFGSNGVVGVDEYSSQGWFRFEDVRSIVESVTSQNTDGDRIDALIEQSTESASLEGTKRKYVTTKAIKQARPDNPTNYEYFKPIKFYPLDLPHLVPVNQRGGITGFPALFRSDTQFRISVGLAKFNENAREIANVAMGCHEAVGIQVLAEIDTTFHPGIAGNPMANQAIQWVNRMCLDATQDGQDLIRLMNQWNHYWKIPWKMYFVRYDEGLEKEFLTWEKDLAEILGKYYANFDMMQNWERCDPRGFGHFRRFDSTVPSSEAYTRDGVATGLKPFPFNNVLKDPYGLDINTNLFGPAMGPFAINQFNILTRSGAAWDTSIQEFDQLFRASAPGTNDPDILDKWVPRFIPVGQNVEAWILKCLPHLNFGMAGGGNVTNWAANMITLNDANSRQAVMNALIEASVNGGDASGRKVGLYLHPDYSHPNFPFKLFGVSYTGYQNLKEKSIKDNTNMMSSNYRDKCPLLCGGISPRQMFCDGLNHLFQSRAWPQGLERWNMALPGIAPFWTLPAFGFMMTYTFPPTPLNPAFHTPPPTEVVYPTWTSYIANHKSDMYRRILDPKIMLIINGMMADNTPPGNVAQVEIQENDVSSMIEQDGIGNINVKIPSNYTDPAALGGNFHRFGNAVWDQMNMVSYHVSHVAANEVPTLNAIYGRAQKTLSCTVAGMEFGSLAPYCNPSYGLVSCSVRLGNEGVSSELRFTNKPPKSIDQKVLFKSIQPDIIRAGGIFPMF